MAIRKDEYSLKRYKKNIKITLYLAFAICIFLAPSLFIFGLISLTNKTISFQYSIPLVIFACLWIIQLISFFIIEGMDPFYIQDDKQAPWKNQWKWVLISVLCLNITLFFLITYSNIMRKIYNTLLE